MMDRRAFLKNGGRALLGAAALPFASLPWSAFAGDDEFTREWSLAPEGNALLLHRRGKPEVQVRYVLKHDGRFVEATRVELVSATEVRVEFPGAWVRESWSGGLLGTDGPAWARARREFTVTEPGRWRLSFTLRSL